MSIFSDYNTSSRTYIIILFYPFPRHWQILTFGGLRKKEERKERKKERKERKKKVFPLRVGFRNYILFGCFLGITVAIS